MAKRETEEFNAYERLGLDGRLGDKERQYWDMLNETGGWWLLTEALRQKLIDIDPTQTGTDLSGLADGSLLAVMGNALAASSLRETDTQIIATKDSVFNPNAAIGSTFLGPIGDSLYLRSDLTGRMFTPVGAPFDENGTGNPMYVALSASEDLPEAAQQRVFSDTLVVADGTSMDITIPGAAGTDHIARTFEVRSQTAGDVRLEIYIDDIDGSKVVDQIVTLNAGTPTVITLNTLPHINPAYTYLNRFTAEGTDLTIEGVEVSGTFIPYFVATGWPYEEVRVLTEQDGAFIADLLEALTGTDRLDINATRNSGMDLVGVAQGSQSNVLRFTRRDGTTQDVTLTGGPSFLAPRISRFDIAGVGPSVPENFLFTGEHTYQFTVENPSNVQGRLELVRDGGVILTQIEPTDTSFTFTDTQNLITAGESITWTLRGTDTNGDPFSRDYTIRGRQPQEHLYYDNRTSNDGASADISEFTSVDVTQAGTSFDLTQAVANTEWLVILAPTNRALASLIDTATQGDSLADFTQTNNVRTIGGQTYISYAHQNNSGFDGTFSFRGTTI